MAKYLINNSGELEEATPTVTSQGVATANQIIQTDASGKLDPTLFPSGVMADAISVLASETINAGDQVNIYSNSGTANVRKAIATGQATKAHGYSPAGAASGSQCTVYFDDVNTTTGLTAGEQYLSPTTAGKTQTTAPTASGQIVQKVGVASSATTLHQSYGPSIKLA